MVRRLGTVVLAAVCLAGISTMPGCGPATPASSPTRPLPGYSGRAADLFDDAIDPAGVGMDFDKGYTPKGDPLLRERAQVSDAVLRVKVQTVTGKTDGPERSFQLGLHTVEKMTGQN